MRRPFSLYRVLYFKAQGRLVKSLCSVLHYSVIFHPQQYLGIRRRLVYFYAQKQKHPSLFLQTARTIPPLTGLACGY